MSANLFLPTADVGNYSYVAALELRIEKLERRLQYAKSRKASVALHDSDSLAVAQVDRRDSLASIRAAIHRKAARNRENSDVNSLVSDLGFLYEAPACRSFKWPTNPFNTNPRCLCIDLSMLQPEILSRLSLT